MEKIIINNREYAWGDVSVFLFGQPVLNILGVSYKTKKTKTVGYGQGRNPRRTQHGKREYDGTLTLTQSEVIALNRSARAKGYKDILDVDFDIIVKYATEEGVMTIDKICCASFTESGSELKEGDAEMSIALPLIALDIQLDITA